MIKYPEASSRECRANTFKIKQEEYDMNRENGNISIHAQNIMPIIKRWLYSDKDIFIREMVSNGCDAITKYKMIHPGTEEDFRVTVEVDKEKSELRFIDNGIGMTAEEVHKYINQVAFSSAEEFLKNYGSENAEKGGIIGHFGLGFYSAFMVADRVTIDTLSHNEGSEAVRWESADGMQFEMSSSDKTERGTVITLHISEEEKEFLETYRVREVLERYCGYLAIPVYLKDLAAKPVPAEKKEGTDGEEEQEQEPKMPVPQQVNETSPLWLKNPKDCTDEEYKAFYRKLFHEFEDPLFWVHLNVEYPFNLKGILYFPKLKNDFGAKEGEIKLFSGQVFVANNIKEVIPEFLMLLKGVIDCPDLPLNVSRSFLQNDGYVKKLSAHITKKVGDRLTALFNTQRETYQTYWDDIHPFIKFGCIRDMKFFDAVKSILLVKTTAGEYYTLEEYKSRNSGKAGKKIYYTNDSKRQAASVELYTQRGIDVAVMEHVIDSNFLSFMEYGGGLEDVTFARVDADVESLKEESEEGKDVSREALEKLFREALDQKDLEVKLEALSNRDLSALLVEDEQSRRFKEMSRMYGQEFKMPEKFTLVLNRLNLTVQSLAAREPNEVTTLICQQMFDLARMAAQPLDPDEVSAFLARSQKLLGMVAGH
jgi:molecular chaperone HtpG